MIVMSCHVMSCRHCCINSKKYLSKTFSFHKIIYKYFAGFLACINKIKSFAEGVQKERGLEKSEAKARRLASNPICVDCHASLRFARNDGKNKNRTRCAPHGDDNIFCDNKNFQFDKFQRLLSVIYKKNLLITKEISK